MANWFTSCSSSCSSARAKVAAMSDGKLKRTLKNTTLGLGGLTVGLLGCLLVMDEPGLAGAIFGPIAAISSLGPYFKEHKRRFGSEWWWVGGGKSPQIGPKSGRPKAEGRPKAPIGRRSR